MRGGAARGNEQIHPNYIIDRRRSSSSTPTATAKPTPTPTQAASVASEASHHHGHVTDDDNDDDVIDSEAGRMEELDRFAKRAIDELVNPITLLEETPKYRELFISDW